EGSGAVDGGRDVTGLREQSAGGDADRAVVLDLRGDREVAGDRERAAGEDVQMAAGSEPAHDQRHGVRDRELAGGLYVAAVVELDRARRPGRRAAEAQGGAVGKEDRARDGGLRGGAEGGGAGLGEVGGVERRLAAADGQGAVAAALAAVDDAE